MTRTISTFVALAAAVLLAASPAAAEEFDIEPGSFRAGSFHGDGAGKYAPLGDGATADARAGAHPFLAATNFSFSSQPVGTGYLPNGALRNVVVELPPGFAGNPTVVTPCPQEVLINTGFCPLDSAVGITYIPLLGIPFGVIQSNPEPGRFSLPPST